MLKRSSSLAVGPDLHDMVTEMEQEQTSEEVGQLGLHQDWGLSPASGPLQFPVVAAASVV